MQTATPIELGQIAFVANLSCLYHTYIRSQAYLAAEHGKEAATEFQNSTDHSSILWNCWTGALAHLGVARANALNREPRRERMRTRPGSGVADYKDFLTLWKDADPEIPP